MSSFLRADVWVSSRLPIASTGSGERSSWSPISSTLIQGDSEAVLVDTPISVSQTEELIKWILETAPGKDLTYLYITHGHGDHWFGLPTLKRQWPNLRAIATPSVIEHMKGQITPAFFEGLWLKFFPGGQIAPQAELAEPLTSSTFQVEGHEFHAIEVGHTDTHSTTVLHVPSIRLVVAGDVVYGDVHQYFAEATTPEKRKEWLKAIETIEKLDPHLVVAGHKRPGTCDGIFNLKSTREYIIAFEEAVQTSSSWEELYKKIITRFPSRINPHAVVLGAKAAFPPKS
jgi:glyoxylase-like metal-dependent hydrolase (beta-lactamase superfamily II)